jgi:hypothetical protein
VFTAFGTVTPEKRIPLAIRALAALAPSLPDLHLLLVGEPVHYYDARAEADALGVGARVTTTGFVDEREVAAYLAASDACLCLRWPSSRETSAAWLRAVAAGRPTIVTDLVHTVDVPAVDPRNWITLHAPAAEGAKGVAAAPPEPVCVGIRAVEPASCPSLTKGVYAYDFGDTAGMTPLMKMHTLGHDFIPDPIHAGGLRYHGMSPLLSHIYELGLIEAVAKTQRECFEAGVRFARTEGILPAPEPTHALAACIEEALRCKETGEERVILTALCGHGHLDLAAYGAHLAGELDDHEFSDEQLAAAMAGLPAVPA